MNLEAIENAARELLADIYRSEQRERPGMLSPMQMIEPEIAATHLGYDFGYQPSLGCWGSANQRFEIAGLIDRQRRIIRISEKFPRDVGRFTGAHEVGHLVLDHPGTVIHRDRPMFGWPQAVLDLHEREANYFAACLLAPRRLLESEYMKRFGIDPPLPLIDKVAFNLCGQSAHALMRAGSSSMQFASAVASARSFNGRHFRSLAEAFNISVGAMAVRLREARFVED